MEDVKGKVELRNNKVRTPASREIDNRMRKAKYQLENWSFSEETKLDLIRQLKRDKLESLEVRMYTKPSDRVFYSRYADDFLIGIAASYQYSCQIKEALKKALKKAQR